MACWGDTWIMKAYTSYKKKVILIGLIKSLRTGITKIKYLSRGDKTLFLVIGLNPLYYRCRFRLIRQAILALEYTKNKVSVILVNELL